MLSILFAFYTALQLPISHKRLMGQCQHPTLWAGSQAGGMNTQHIDQE